MALLFEIVLTAVIGWIALIAGGIPCGYVVIVIDIGIAPIEDQIVAGRLDGEVVDRIGLMLIEIHSQEVVPVLILIRGELNYALCEV